MSYQYRDTDPDPDLQCRDTDPDPDPYPDPRFVSPLKFNRLFSGPLPTFPENFMQIHSDVFVQSC